MSTLAFGNIDWSVTGVTNKGTFITTISQTLTPGWYTYWKNPGESGAKASIESTTQGVTFEPLQFPKPSIITTEPFVTFGYKHHVNYTLPILIPDQTSNISATFYWLECADVCIPKETELTLSIPNTPPPIINKYQAKPSITASTHFFLKHTPVFIF